MQAYVELKLAWSLFQKAPENLSPAERSQLGKTAARQSGLEERILRAPEAAGIVIPASTLENRLREIRQRYGTGEDYLEDLERIGLTASSLAEAVARDLRVETVLERIAAAVPEVTEVEAEIYYRLNPLAFERPEARRLRHILVTFNDPGEREAARQDLEKLRATVRSPDAFGKAALRHSQCPTAMQDGVLGLVKRGQLYPELEPAAFELGEGEVSAVLQSPIGLHILRCDQVFPAARMEFAQVRERMVAKLTGLRREKAQREWIKALAE